MAYTNGGAQLYNKTAELILLLLKVHFKEQSISNILCMMDITNMEGVRVTMYTKYGTSIFVTLKNRESLDFNNFLSVDPVQYKGKS